MNVTLLIKTTKMNKVKKTKNKTKIHIETINELLETCKEEQAEPKKIVCSDLLYTNQVCDSADAPQKN